MLGAITVFGRFERNLAFLVILFISGIKRHRKTRPINLFRQVESVLTFTGKDLFNIISHFECIKGEVYLRRIFGAKI